MEIADKRPIRQQKYRLDIKREMQRVSAHHLIQRADFKQHGFGQTAINLDKGNRLAACFTPPKVKGRDVDSMLATKAAEPTNEARLVIIAKIKKMWWEIRFDGDMLHLDNSRLITTNQSSSNRSITRFMRDRYPKQSFIIALAIMANC
jgi:hypothetical protein